MKQFFQINLQSLLDKFGHIQLHNLLWCSGIVIATLLLKRPVSLLIAKLSAAIANRFCEKRHRQMFLDLTVKPVEMLLQVSLYYIAVNQLDIFLTQIIFRRVHANKALEIRVSDVADKLFLLLVIIFLTFAISRIIDFIFHVLIDNAYKKQDKEKEQLFPLIKEVVKIIIWTIGIFWILGSVFNVNIPALVTGLGIGGVAIALAAKESVENFFASFTILTDKPFQSGDNVKLGSLEGKVERIGFRSTRLRNSDGSVYIIPNKKLVNENLENLTQRDTSKVHIGFNLKYGMSEERLQKLMSELKTMIQKTLHVIEPVDVFLESFKEGSFQLSVDYHLPEPLQEGVVEKDIRQVINFKAYKIVSAYTTAVEAAGPEQENKSINNHKEQNKDSDDARMAL